ncbi:MAG: hypothetical protein JWQ92_81 [Amnibacterium sp.]|nr:hypothetical protein [Amnibacterium sp.]
MVAVADAFVRHGWRVRVLSGAPLRSRAEAVGAEFVELPAAGDVHDEEAHSERRAGLKALNEGATAAFLTPAPAAWAALEAALEAEPAELVVAELAFVGAAGIAGLPAESRPTAVVCGVVPLGISSPDVAPFGLGLAPMRGPLNRARNRVLTRLATRVLLAPMHREADRTLAAIGAAPLDGRFFMDFVLAADLFAQFTVPAFEYPRRDLPPNVRFYGPVSRGVTSTTPLPTWWDELDNRPIVHVSQGTVANGDFGELVAPTFAALGNEDVQIVVTTGGPPVSALPAMPPNAFAAEFIPYDRLLPRTDVFVTNGGYGGLHYAMEYGVPVVVAGDTEDKPENAARVAWSGIGIDLRTGRPSARRIRHAVRRVLADPGYMTASARIGAAIRWSRGADGLVDDLEDPVFLRQA